MAYPLCQDHLASGAYLRFAIKFVYLSATYVPVIIGTSIGYNELREELKDWNQKDKEPGFWGKVEQSVSAVLLDWAPTIASAAVAYVAHIAIKVGYNYLGGALASCIAMPVVDAVVSAAGDIPLNFVSDTNPV